LNGNCIGGDDKLGLRGGKEDGRKDDGFHVGNLIIIYMKILFTRLPIN